MLEEIDASLCEHMWPRCPTVYDKQRGEGIVDAAGMVPYKGWATDLVNDCFNSFIDLRPLFYKERGNHFMYREGHICMAIIEACLEQNIPVFTA